MDAPFLTAAKDAGVVIVLIVSAYFILGLIFNFFSRIQAGDRVDFETIKTMWKEQATLQKETNLTQREVNMSLVELVHLFKSFTEHRTEDFEKVHKKLDLILARLDEREVK